MVNKVKIEYLPTARLDLIEIFDYIAKDNLDSAEKLLNEFDKAINRLAELPEIGSIPKDIRLQRLNYRMLVVDKYLVFYVILNDIIEIRRIIHGKRKYSFLL